MKSNTHAAAHLSRRPPVSPATRIMVLVTLGLATLGVVAPLTGQARKSGEPGSAAIRIRGGVVRIGNQPAGSLRSFSDRGGLARIIGSRLTRAGDPRANRFGPEVRDPDRLARRSLRGGHYDPYPSNRDSVRRGSPGYADHDRRYLTPPAVPPTPVTLGRAYDLRGPPSFTAIRPQDEELVGGGFRLQPLLLPTLVVFAAYPVWRGSLFDPRPPR